MTLGFEFFSYYKGIAVIQGEVMRFFTWTTRNVKGGADLKNSVKGDSMSLQDWVDRTGERKQEICGQEGRRRRAPLPPNRRKNLGLCKGR